MICNICKIDKEISEFSTTRAGYKKYIAKMCKSCNKDRVRKYRENNEYILNERKIARNRKFLNIEKYLFNMAKKRAKYNNIEFNINIEDIKIPKYCPILNIELKVNNEVAKNNSLSLDRIDNNKGYIKGNIAVISRLANAMKSSCSHEELITFGKNIKTYLDQNKSDKLLESPEEDNQQPIINLNG